KPTKKSNEEDKLNSAKCRMRAIIMASLQISVLGQDDTNYTALCCESEWIIRENETFRRHARRVCPANFHVQFSISPCGLLRGGGLVSEDVGGNFAQVPDDAEPGHDFQRVVGYVNLPPEKSLARGSHKVVMVVVPAF